LSELFRVDVTAVTRDCEVLLRELRYLLRSRFLVLQCVTDLSPTSAKIAWGTTMLSSLSRASSVASSRAGVAWLAFCAALALHITDEALTGFLSVYNPTILAFRPYGWWFPPTFEFRTWLTGLIVGVTILSALAPFFFRGARWVRPLGYLLAVMIGILNALGHITGTVLGHTLPSVRFARPMPGFYSSPILLAASLYLLLRLREAGRMASRSRM
jgi:hypothetical protein